MDNGEDMDSPLLKGTTVIADYLDSPLGPGPGNGDNSWVNIKENMDSPLLKPPPFFEGHRYDRRFLGQPLMSRP